MNDNEIIFAKIKTLDDLEGEEWRNVRNHKHYFVSNYGRVKRKVLLRLLSPRRVRLIPN